MQRSQIRRFWKSVTRDNNDTKGENYNIHRKGKQYCIKEIIGINLLRPTGHVRQQQV